MEVLRYRLSQLTVLPEANEYPFTCPLEVHCHYNVNQIMAAFDYFNQDQSPEFREGVKYFADKKTDIFLINLNKSEKTSPRQPCMRTMPSMPIFSTGRARARTGQPVPKSSAISTRARPAI